MRGLHGEVGTGSLKKLLLQAEGPPGSMYGEYCVLKTLLGTVDLSIKK